MAAYVRGYRARKRGLELAVTGAAPDGRPGERATVTALNPPKPAKPREPGRAEQAVIDQCAMLSTAKDKPALVEAALAMARILDNPNLATTQPSAAQKLESLLAALGKGAEARRGRLARVQSMTTRSIVDAG